MSTPPLDQENLQNAVRSACDYWETLARILPVMGVGGFVAMITNLQRIAYEKTWLRRTLLCLSVLGIGCVSGGVAVLGLSLFLAAPTTEFDLVAAAIAGSAGQKTFDVYGRKLFGWRTRSDDPEQIQREQEREGQV